MRNRIVRTALLMCNPKADPAEIESAITGFITIKFYNVVEAYNYQHKHREYTLDGMLSLLRGKPDQHSQQLLRGTPDQLQQRIDALRLLCRLWLKRNSL